MNERCRILIYYTIIFLFAAFLVAVFTLKAEAQTLGGQCPPALPAECQIGLECPYPGVTSSVAQQQALARIAGPWHLRTTAQPLPGMVREYATALDWWRAVAGQPWGAAVDAHYCLDPNGCGIGGHVLKRVAAVLRPWPDSGIWACWEKTGDHGQASSAWGGIYRGIPTLAQGIRIECGEQRGVRWIADQALHAAQSCKEGGGCTDPGLPWAPAPGFERWAPNSWLAFLQGRCARLARYDAGDVRCWRELGTPGCGIDPPPPPPPPPEPPAPEPEPDPDECDPCPDPSPSPPPVRTDRCLEVLDRMERQIRQRREHLEWTEARCVAALPDGTWHRADAGQYCRVVQFWRRSALMKFERETLELSRQCRGDLTPGDPSTGRLEVELLPLEER